MYGDSPLIPDRRSTARRVRSNRIREMLEELDRVGAMASAAMPTKDRSSGWADLGTDSEVTDAQSDFIDYWTPELVLQESQAKRDLILTLDEWARTEPGQPEQRLVNRILDQLTSPITAGELAGSASGRRPRVGLIPREPRGLPH